MFLHLMQLKEQAHAKHACPPSQNLEEVFYEYGVGQYNVGRKINILYCMIHESSNFL